MPRQQDLDVSRSGALSLDAIMANLIHPGCLQQL